MRPFRGRMIRLMMSQGPGRPFHDQYAQPPLLKYRPQGTSRDTWIYDLKPLTQVQHTKTLEELYWESKLGKPEFRGKAKSARISSQDRGSGVKVQGHMVPRVAGLFEDHLPPVASHRTYAQLRPEQRAANEALSNRLAGELLLSSAHHTLRHHRS